MPMCHKPEPRAVALQTQIDASIRTGPSSYVSIPAGDYYFGNKSLVIHRADHFTLHAEAGAGKVQLWFCIGAGLLVSQSSNVMLDRLTIDYDPPAHYQGTIIKVAEYDNDVNSNNMSMST